MRILKLLLLAGIVGGAAYYMSKDALPGDSFYAVKLNFNETITKIISFNPDGKAEYYRKITAMRLEEFEKLSIKGTISPEVGKSLTDNFSAVVDRATDTIKTLETPAALLASAKLSSLLQAHSTTLVKLRAVETDDIQLVTGLSTVLNNKIIDTTRSKIQLETAITSEKQADFSTDSSNMAKIAKEAAIRAKSLTNQTKGAFSKILNERFGYAIQTGEILTNKGDEQIQNNFHSEALVLFSEAYEEVEEMNIFIELNLKLDSYSEKISGTEKKNSSWGSGLFNAESYENLDSDLKEELDIQTD